MQRKGEGNKKDQGAVAAYSLVFLPLLIFQGFLSPPVRAHIEAQPAHRNTLFLLHLPEVSVTCGCIEPRLPGLVRIKHPARKCALWADIDACSAVTAAGFHRSPC